MPSVMYPSITNQINSEIDDLSNELKKSNDFVINLMNNNNNIIAKNMLDNQIKMQFNQENIMKNNNMFFYNKDMLVINNFKNNILNTRNRMLTKNIDPNKTNLQIKLMDKFTEFQTVLTDTYKFANHRNISDQQINNIRDKFYIDYSNLDPMNKGDAVIKQGIKLIDGAIRSLHKFTSNNDFTVVVQNQTSGLKRTAEHKRKEMFRLIECGKKLNIFFTGNMYTTQANNFYLSIDFKNPIGLNMKLQQAIQYFDFAIASIQQFDDGITQSTIQKWQNQAYFDIDGLLNQATQEMQNSPNQTTVAGIKQEFQPLLCGKQKWGNCWLHAICNIMNFNLYITNQHQNIIKNTGVRNANRFDNVEKFFAQPQFGLSMDKLKHLGGTIDEDSIILSKLGINHSKVFIAVEKNNIQSRETNTKIIKTLLLKHFSNSINPVLISNRYDECSFDTGNRMGGSHAMAIVGLDISTNSVVVADSNHEDLQVYSLDRIASTMCNGGITDHTVKQIGMIFPSFTNINNFHYNNGIHSWDEFKSNLLPAISESF